MVYCLGGLVAQARGHLRCYTGRLVASQEWFHGGVPSAAPSAHLGPREEGWDVPHRHIPRQCLHTQVAVICQQHHLPQQPDWLLCRHERVEGLH